MKRAYRQGLTTRDENDLAVPYALVTSGKDPNRVDKRRMVSALVAAMPWPLLTSHNAHIAALDLESGRSLTYYRAMGSGVVNEFLRTGAISMDPFPWQAVDRISDRMVFDKRAAQTLKPPTAGAPPPPAAVKKIADGLVKIAADELRAFITDGVVNAAAVFRHVALLKAAIDGCPGLPQDVTLWRGEVLDVDFFYRPKTARQKATSKYAFRMRDLEKGDTFTRPDFTSFSADVVTSHRFTRAGCCLFRLRARKGAKVLVLDGSSHPLEYKCIAQAGSAFRVTGVTDVASTVSRHASFRVIDICAVR